MQKLLKEIKQCTKCAAHLEHGVNPVMAGSTKSKIAIIGQAPGRIVHETGIAWDDKSGEKLRQWLDVGKEVFYDTNHFAIIPMGFCYPGKGKSGDLAPRKECAPQWHPLLWERMKNIELIILIGSYAQSYYLGKNSLRTLTETVKNFEVYLPKYFVLPHPSPRNNIWFAKNDWYAKDVIPALKKEVKRILSL